VTEILGPVGVDEKMCCMVTQLLWAAEGDKDSFPGSEMPADEESTKLILKKEVGLTTFLVKLGQGMGKRMLFCGLQALLTDIGTQRGNPQQTHVYLCIHHWYGVPIWWNHPAPSLLLHPMGASRPCVFNNHHWHCPPHLWHGQSPHNRCRSEPRRIHMGCSEHTNGGRYGSCCSVQYRQSYERRQYLTVWG